MTAENNSFADGVRAVQFTRRTSPNGAGCFTPSSLNIHANSFCERRTFDSDQWKHGRVDCKKGKREREREKERERKRERWNKIRQEVHLIKAIFQSENEEAHLLTIDRSYLKMNVIVNAIEWVILITDCNGQHRAGQWHCERGGGGGGEREARERERREREREERERETDREREKRERERQRERERERERETERETETETQRERERWTKKKKRKKKRNHRMSMQFLLCSKEQWGMNSFCSMYRKKNGLCMFSIIPTLVRQTLQFFFETFFLFILLLGKESKTPLSFELPHLLFTANRPETQRIHILSTVPEPGEPHLVSLAVLTGYNYLIFPVPAGCEHWSD